MVYQLIFHRWNMTLYLRQSWHGLFTVMKFYLLLLIIIDRTSYELINMYVPWYISRQGLSDSSALPSCYAVIRRNGMVDHDRSWNSWVADWLSCNCISMIYIVPSCTVESIGILEVSRGHMCVDGASWVVSCSIYIGHQSILAIQERDGG